jgi:hypothetical protein
MTDPNTICRHTCKHENTRVENGFVMFTERCTKCSHVAEVSNPLPKRNRHPSDSNYAWE